LGVFRRARRYDNQSKGRSGRLVPEMDRANRTSNNKQPQKQTRTKTKNLLVLSREWMGLGEWDDYY
jgi:hypothetical protein